MMVEEDMIEEENFIDTKDFDNFEEAPPNIDVNFE